MTLAVVAVLMTLTGTIDPNALPDITALLRTVAEKAGCKPDDVRVAIRWSGPETPVLIQVSCQADS